MPVIEFLLHGKPTMAAMDDLVIAGWTGRDAASVEHHIARTSGDRGRASPQRSVLLSCGRQPAYDRREHSMLPARMAAAK